MALVVVLVGGVSVGELEVVSAVCVAVAVVVEVSEVSNVAVVDGFVVVDVPELHEQVVAAYVHEDGWIVDDDERA